MALATPVASSLSVTATSQTVTLSKASGYVFFTNTDADGVVSIAINASSVTSLTGIVIKPGETITVNTKDIGRKIASFSAVCPATKAAVLAYQAL